MLSISDPKLSQQARVVLKRLPSVSFSDAPDPKLSQQAGVVLKRLPSVSFSDALQNDNEKERKPTRQEQCKRASSEDIKKSNLYPPIKKENKIFKKSERFSQMKCSNSSFLKFTKPVLDSSMYVNCKKLKRIVKSKSKECIFKEVKIENEGEEILNGVIKKDISNNEDLHERPHYNENYKDRKIKIHNQSQPLIQLVPFIKTEEPEVITVKKFQLKVKNIFEIIDDRPREKEIPFGNTAGESNPLSLKEQINDLMSKNALISIPITEEYLNYCKSIPSSNTSQNQRSDPIEEAPLNQVSNESTPRNHDSRRRIKVKSPQVLGIITQENPPSIPQSEYSQNQVDLTNLYKIKSTSENEPIISEICRIYPIFFTDKARQDISILVQILFKASQEVELELLKTKQCNEKCLLNTLGYSKEFVHKFNKILKLDQIGSDGDLLKKVIPILYLCIDKAFKRLRPNEDFDFRYIMKEVFKIESFVCNHDVLLEKDYGSFQKILITIGRWLEDIFIECDVHHTGFEDAQCLSERISAGPSVGLRTFDESENDYLATLNSKDGEVYEDTNNEVATKIDDDASLKYLRCPLCKEHLPSCFICKELLSCPCLTETHVLDRGPKSITLCVEHSECGQNWQEWMLGWTEEREDHNMPLNPVCWNQCCSNRADYLCICRVRSFCSLECQAEDWFREHHKTCTMASDPNCLVDPGGEETP